MHVCLNLAIPCNISEIVDPANGSVSIIGLNAIYTCNTGYTLNGSMIKTCGNDKKWSLETPICESEPLYISFRLIFHYIILLLIIINNIYCICIIIYTVIFRLVAHACLVAL